MGTLKGFPYPPAMVRGEQSSPAPHARRAAQTGVVAALLAAWTGAAWAQAQPQPQTGAGGGDRPSEQDIFGGTAPTPAVPAPGAPETPAAPAGANQTPGTTPPAAAAAGQGGSERD